MSQDGDEYPAWVEGDDLPGDVPSEDEDRFRRDTLPRLLKELREKFADNYARHEDQKRALLTPERIEKYLEACRARGSDPAVIEAVKQSMGSGPPVPGDVGPDPNRRRHYPKGWAALIWPTTEEEVQRAKEFHARQLNADLE
jgi:hypothetical protein